MRRNKETGEKILNEYEQEHYLPRFTGMPQRRRDKIAVCIVMGGLTVAIKAYGFDNVAAVYLCHPGLRTIK